MRTLYFDCFAGISGDMTLSALLDLGLSPRDIEAEIHKLGIPGISLHTEKVLKKGIRGTRLKIKFPSGKQPHRTLKYIHALLDDSELSPGAKEKSRRIFNLLALAEGKVHGIPSEEVHFHEVGALDSLVDIIGSAVAVEMLEAKQIIASPLPFSRGFVEAAHGLLPLPAPATVEICREKNIPHVPAPIKEMQGELVTPTGAAFLGALAETFGPPPAMLVQKVGYGAGTRDYPFPNLLRVFLADVKGGEAEHQALERNILMETNIDDMNPEYYEYVMECLFKEGALDVYVTPIQMKKNRPAVTLSILAPPEKAAVLRDTVFRETSSIGLRETKVTKRTLERTYQEVATPYGPVRVKVARLRGAVVNSAPEYEDCLRIARTNQIPLKTVYATVLALLAQDTP